jgi:dTDP-L-rhamnose 4-epimerase
VARILISGGAGFIGSNLARRFSDDGHDVTVIDNLLPQVHGEAPRDGALFRSTSQVADVVVGDVMDRGVLRRVLTGQDAIVHLAAETGTGQSMYEIERYTRVNVGGTALLLDILANDERRTVKKIVVASSRSLYGEGAYLSQELGLVYPATRLESDLVAGRFDPTYEGDVSGLQVVPTSEASKVHPSSVYGITKQTQESLVMTVSPTLGIAPVALRYQNVFGPGQSLTNPYTGILSIFSSRIRLGQPINVFEDGLESRDFVFIDDVVTATARATLEARADGRILNVGSGVATTVSEVVTELMRAYGRAVPVHVTGNFRLGDIRHNVADLTLARKVLDYEPSVTLRAGVEAFAAWVVQQEQTVTDGYEASLDEMRRKNLLK